MAWAKQLNGVQARWWIWLLLAGLVAYIGLEARDLNRQIALAQHQSELNLIRSGLLEAWERYQVQPAADAGVGLGVGNPLRSMTVPNISYGGEFDGDMPALTETWLFDRQQQCLVYVFNNGDVHAYRLVSVIGQGRAAFAAGGWDLHRVQGYKKRGG
jgi:hypothetical protein